MKGDPTFLGPFAIAHLISMTQLLIVLGSAAIALWSLRNSARTARADVKYKLLKEGRDLRIKYDEALRLPQSPQRERTLDDFHGLIFAYYAGAFELSSEIRLSADAKKMLTEELRSLFRSEAFVKKWDKIHMNFGQRFRRIACEMRGGYGVFR